MSRMIKATVFALKSEESALVRIGSTRLRRFDQTTLRELASGSHNCVKALDKRAYRGQPGIVCELHLVVSPLANSHSSIVNVTVRWWRTLRGQLDTDAELHMSVFV